MKIKWFYQACLLVFIIFGIYYSAIFSEFNPIDDYKLINKISNLETYDWFEYLKPGSSFYYRPLLIYSYYLDKLLWDLDSGFMHLVNMVFHAGNALLVFFISRRVCIALFKFIGFLPLAAALLFALHPINSESVNWISGRTDVLATFFVLAALLLLIRCVEAGHWVWAIPAALVFLAGVMSKEVVLFFLPMGCYLLWRWPAGEFSGPLTSLRLRSITCFASPFLLGAVVYGVSRFARFGIGDAGFNFVLKNYGYDLGNTLRVVFKVFGFYVKKLFVPMPLNFAITNAHDAYVWLGLAAAIAMIALISLRRLAADFLVMALFLIAPAIIIALTRVAWTPFAERYLYLSSAFWAVAVAVAIYQAGLWVGKPGMVTGITAVTLAGAGWVTYERNIVWQSNLAMFEDTVRKSPDFLPARNELASALVKAGRKEEAKSQLALAVQRDTGKKVQNIHFNTILGMIREKDFNGARNALANLQNQAEGRDTVRFLEQVVRVHEAMLKSGPDDELKQKILVDLFSVYEKLMKIKSDPFLPYRAGQLAMHLGKKGKAADYFKEAYLNAPDSAYYKPSALILMQKLSENEASPSH